MEPRNFTSGLLIFAATMAVTYRGASLGENATPGTHTSLRTASSLGEPIADAGSTIDPPVDRARVLAISIHYGIEISLPPAADLPPAP